MKIGVSDQKPSVLLTASADLVTSDAAYGEVVGALEELAAAAQEVLEPAAAPPPPPPGSKVRLVALAGDIASAVPPLMSLLAPPENAFQFRHQPGYDGSHTSPRRPPHPGRAGSADR